MQQIWRTCPLPSASAFTSHPQLLASHPHDTCETGHGRTLMPTARHWLPFIFPGHVSGADRLLTGRNAANASALHYRLHPKFFRPHPSLFVDHSRVPVVMARWVKREGTRWEKWVRRRGWPGEL